MIRIEIPGREPLVIEHVVLDYNGTIAEDGALLTEAAERIKELRACVKVHVLTADTYGTVTAQCADVVDSIETFPGDAAAKSKAEIVKKLGGETCACFGNGLNDILMFDAAALSVAVLLKEGMCAALLPHADVMVKHIADGLDLLLKPDRLRATLRG